MICITCNKPMTPGGDRPPSMGNPNMCVECVVGASLGRPSTSNPFPNGRWTQQQTLPLGPTMGPLEAPERCEADLLRPGGNQFPADGTAAYGSRDGADNLKRSTETKATGVADSAGRNPAFTHGTGAKPKQTIIGPPPFIDERWGNRE